MQVALDSRIVIEQAKGIVAARGGMSADEAFQKLRTYARYHNQGLHVLAHAVTRGELEISELTASGHRPKVKRSSPRRRDSV